MNKFLLSPMLAISFTAMALPTGLKPLTTKELKLMQRELGLRKVKEVRPTPLGLERVNQVRSRRGLSELPAKDAKAFGRDTVAILDTDDFEAAGSDAPITTEMYGGVLPSAVDNSQLAAFPSIGSQYWNSCVGWAMGYYQWSHNNGLVNGWNNKTDTTKKCSPKFLYTMINAGVDNGAYFSDAFNMLSKHGCTSWANFPEDNNYRTWDINPEHWKSGIPFRSNSVQYVYNMDTTTGLDQAKQLLTNGYVLTFGTYINSWVFTTIKSGSLSGQQALLYVNGTNGSHAMTIVGYDDSAWVDINNNGVVDSGEQGVFKVANSWGTSWKNSGFAFVPYDALKAVSAIAGAPSSGRQPAFQSRLVYHMPVRTNYVPKFLAKFTVKHGLRNQMSLKFGWSTSSGTAATSTYSPFALMNKGGAYAFNGTTTAIDGTFIMDVSDLPFTSTGDNKLYLTLTDSTSGNAGTISSLELLDVATGAQNATNLISPQVADYSSTTVSVVHNTTTANIPPTANFTTSVSSGTAPLAVSMDASGSADSDGTITGYTWNFGDGSSSTGVFTSKTYSSAGTYTTTLTVRDDDGSTNSTTRSVTVTAPASTADTTRPVVYLTNPTNGARIPRYTYFTATANASDNVGVSMVKFYYKGYVKCTDYTAPYTCSIRMVGGTNLAVKARAYDAAGNYSDSTTVYVSN